MAGIAKPGYQVGLEAEHTLLGETGGTGNVNGLFDGKTPSAWNTNEVYYFVKNSGARVDIEFFGKVVIHRYYSWNNNNNQRLKIMKHDGQGYNVDLTSRHLPVADQASNTWRQFTEVLEAGKYRFYLDETDSSMSGRIDGEWYIESKEPIRKYLFKEGEQIKSYSLNADRWNKETSSANIRLANGDKTVTITNVVNMARTKRGMIAGKWYWEYKINDSTYAMVGISNANASLTTSNHTTENIRYYYVNGKTYPGASSYASSFVNGDVIGVALDMDLGTISFYKNGVALGIASNTVKSMGEVYPTVSSGSSSGGPTVTLQALPTEFSYPIPSGYQPYSNSNQWNVIENAVLSMELFNAYGINSLKILTREHIEQLGMGQFEVLCWTDEIGPARKIKINGLSESTLLIGREDVQISAEGTLVINLTQPLNGHIKIIVSGDSGNTWKGTSLVEINDKTSISLNGLTPEGLNSLTSVQVEELFPNGVARFAFYLDKDNVSDFVEIQSLSIGEKQYTISPTATDLSLIYEVLQEEKPTLYASRDDGVSWKEISQDEMVSLSEQPEGKSLRVKAILKNGQEIHAMSYAWA